MKFDDLLNVASLCKELYRIISLRDMGLDTEKIKQRSQTNRMCSWLMKSIMKVEIEKILYNAESLIMRCVFFRK